MLTATQKGFWKRTMVLTLTVGGLLSPVIFSHGGTHHDEEKNKSDEKASASDSLKALKDSIFTSIDAGFDRLSPVFEYSCFNCHSDRTDYPWYHKLPIAKQFIDDDIKQARRHLDMSNGFPFGGHAGPADDLRAIKEEVDKGDMPPFSYRMMHWGSKPSSAQTDSIRAWVDSSLEKLETIGITPSPENEHKD